MGMNAGVHRRPEYDGRLDPLTAARPSATAQLVSNRIADVDRRGRLESIALGWCKALEETVQARAVRDPRFTERFNRMLEFVPHRRHDIDVRVALSPVDGDAEESIGSRGSHPHSQTGPHGMATHAWFDLDHAIRTLDGHEQSLKRG
jgi:hypothetical protein